MADERDPGTGDRPWWGQPYGEDGGRADADHDPARDEAQQPTLTSPAAQAGHPTQPTPTSYPTAPFGPPAAPPPTSTMVLPRPEDGGQRHRVGYALLVVVVALLAGGGGAAAGVHFGKTSSTTHTTYSVTPAASSGGSGSSASGSIEAVAKAVQPAVVSVVEKTSSEEGEGSGIVIDAANGYVLTNNHVVSLVRSSGASLTVTTSDGRSASATVVGGDPSADIAVIKVGLNNLTQARLGDSSTVQVGQTVVAFGSPLGLSGTVTSGIISALDRPVSTSDSSGQSGSQATIDALQTDAAINPGNSGGPLVDLTGAVIGVNSAIASVSQASGLGGQSGESGNIGVGFSIPISEAMYTADQLIKTGHAVHAVIGVSLQPAAQDGSTSGATVAQVTSGGPADKAGIKAGDVIVAVDGKQVPDADTAIVAIRAGHKPGDVVKVTVQRGGSQQTFSVTLGASDPS